MLHDLKHAYRMLLQSKGWTTVVLLSLAIGIGATTALFTAVNGLLLQTVAVPNPGDLVVLKWSGKNNMVRSSSDYGFSRPHKGENVRSTFSNNVCEQLKSANQTMTDVIAGTSLEGFNFASGGSSEIATAFGVSGNYFKVLGVSAEVGRTIEESDAQPGAELVAVVSHGFWQRRFSGDTTIVGKTVRLNNTQVTIVGVLPASFIGIQRMAEQSRDVFVPYMMEPRLAAASPPTLSAPPPKPRIDEPTNWYLQIAGRLKPGVTIEQVKGNLAGPFEHAARGGMQSFE